MKTGKPIPDRVFNAQKGGFVTGADSIIDDGLQMSQAQINAILMSDAISVSLSASPSPVFVGVAVNISLVASVNTASTSIVIKKGSATIASGSGTSLNGSDSITPSVAGNTTYTAEFAVGSTSKSTSKSVVAVYPIRTGTGASYVEGTPLSSPKTSPAGTYNINVAQNGSYIWFNVPSSMTIHGATMSGFEFPLEVPTNVTINGVAYKSYRSSNTYNAGTLTIVIS